MKKLLFSLLMLIITASYGYAQDDEFEWPVNLGIYAGGNINMHNPEYNMLIFNQFDTLSQSVNPGSNGFGWNAGFIVNYPIDNTFTLSGRLGLQSLNGSFDSQFESVLTGTPTRLTTDFDVSLLYLEFSPVLQIHNLLPVKRLYFLAGIETGFPITAQYDLNQTLAIRDTLMLQDTNFTGVDIEDPSIRFGLAIGAGYVFNLSEHTYLTPELSLRFPFTNVTSNDPVFESWTVPQLRLGVNLTFGLGGEEEQKPTADHFINVGFDDVSYYDREGNKAPLEKIKVEEVQYTELYPMLPKVFCAEDSPYPQPETQILSAEAETGEFTVQSLPPDAMRINMHTLDIIGERMKKYPKTSIKIIGTNDGKSETMEVSKKRAEFAKNYLVVNYGINTNRITTEARKLPEVPSAQNNPDGIEENRRIEFESKDSELLQPIIIEEEKKSIVDPDLIEFTPKVVSSDSITKWTFEIAQSDKILRSIEGTGQPPALKWVIMPDELSAGEIPVDYSLTATNAHGLNGGETGSVPVEYFSISRKRIEDMPDRTISKYSLVVFPFDKAEISDHDRNIIENNVLPAIKYNSTVQVYGYTDRIGDKDYNKKLAMKRAETVRDLLKSKVKDATYEVYGVGESVEIYENDSPVGRQLSRTVQIYVITPKE